MNEGGIRIADAIKIVMTFEGQYELDGFFHAVDMA